MVLKTFFSTDNYNRLQSIHDRIKTLGDPVLLDAVEHLQGEFNQKYAVYGEPHWVDTPLTKQPVIFLEHGPASQKAGRGSRKKKSK